MIIAGDLHGRSDLAKKIVGEFKREKLVFTGDYVDSFHRPDSDITDTLKIVLDSPALFIVGNHEFNYYGPFAEHLAGYPGHGCCSGFRQSLLIPVGAVLKEHKKRFRLAYQLSGVLITHAGITTGWIEHKRRENDMLELKDIIRFLETADPFSLDMHDSVFAAGYRGGLDVACIQAGPLWCDYNHEFVNMPVEGLNQVFGHTHVSRIKKVDYDKSHNFNVDCLESGGNQVLEITGPEDNPKFRVIDLSSRQTWI